MASEASMAAHEQGKFWEYHDKLYASRPSRVLTWSVTPRSSS